MAKLNGDVSREVAASKMPKLPPGESEGAFHAQVVAVTATGPIRRFAAKNRKLDNRGAAMVVAHPGRTLPYIAITCALIFAAVMPVEVKSAQATLAWDYTASGAAGFVLYCGSASGVYSTRIDVGNTTTFTVTGLTPGSTYYCAATAYDPGRIESAYSAEVVFSIPISPPASAPPTVASRTPALNATGVAVSTPVTATFSESVQQSTISFTLSDPSNVTVPATLSYNNSTFTATLTRLGGLKGCKRTK